MSGAEYDNKTEYEGIRQKYVPTIEKKGLAAVSSSFFAAFYSAFGKYDVVHIHAEGPAFFAWLPKLFGKKVVVVKEKLFNNQYDLASYLYDKYEDKLKNKRQQLGNVELLFRLMKRCDVNTSSDLAPYLTPLTFNEDVRSLCDQISDNIIMGNDKRYMIYSELKSSDLSSDIELREAMGEFMVQWIHLEELVSKLTVNQNVRTRSPFSVNNLKRIFPDSELKKVLKLRRYRNLMVHGVEFPPVDQIKYMTNEVERVCKYLENKNKL